MQPTDGTIEIHSALLKWIITFLVGGNTGLLGLLFRFMWKHYRRYKNAAMVYIEEHEKLVEDYLRRHPEEIPKRYPNYFRRPNSSSWQTFKPRIGRTDNPVDEDSGFSE